MKLLNKKKQKDTIDKLLSRCMTILIVILACVCMTLFFKMITGGEMSVLGYRFYYVITESMDPTIRPYSEIVVKEVEPSTLEEGDIITFRSKDPAIYGLPNTHRIVAKVTDETGKAAFVTQGDHNPQPDSFLVYPEEIYGKVIFHTPPVEILMNVFSFVATPTGFLVVILMPLGLVFGIFVNSFIKEFRRGQEEMIRNREAEKEPDAVQVLVLRIIMTYATAKGLPMETKEQMQQIWEQLLKEYEIK